MKVEKHTALGRGVAAAGVRTIKAGKKKLISMGIRTAV